MHSTDQVDRHRLAGWPLACVLHDRRLHSEHVAISVVLHADPILAEFCVRSFVGSTPRPRSSQLSPDGVLALLTERERYHCQWRKRHADNGREPERETPAQYDGTDAFKVHEQIPESGERYEDTVAFAEKYTRLRNFGQSESPRCSGSESAIQWLQRTGSSIEPITGFSQQLDHADHAGVVNWAGFGAPGSGSANYSAFFPKYLCVP